MTIGVRRIFSQRWSVLWATTYQYDVVGFDEYFIGLLRRDGLNVTILGDHGALAGMWEDQRLTVGSPRLQRVNRDYLLRPVAWHSAAFHPKTYLFGNEAGGRLLVGSGNADLSGLVAGHEVFASFSSDDPVGLGTIAKWRDWMDILVSFLDDRIVAARWQDAKVRLPWLAAAEPSDSSPLLVNLDTPIADQFLQRLSPPVDELHVGAPFWDRKFAALVYLLDQLRPRKLNLYIGAATRLDGAGLVRLLESRACDTSLWTYSEPRFVHAKLVGCISGPAGLLLSGSANLSQGAMLLAARGGGNVEVGVVASGDPASLRAVFTPVGLSLRALTFSELSELTPELISDEALFPLRLLRAERLPDGHLSLAMTPVPAIEVSVTGIGGREAGIGLHVVPSDGTTLYPELARARTLEPWESTESLVFLADLQGRPLSNAVPVDDPEALDAALRTPDDQDRGALGELMWEDLDSPVGRILEELQATCIFEPRGGKSKRHVSVSEERVAEGDSSFWQRIGELDFEAVEGGGRSRFGRSPLDSDPTFAQLRAMLLQAPYLPDLRPIRSAEPSDTEIDDPDAAKARWSVETRQRVRVFNVLKRWCRAVRDPELFAIDPLLSTHDYVALLQALAELWLGDDGQRNFSEEHLHQLLWILLESLVGKAGPNRGIFEIGNGAAQAAMLGDLRAHQAPEWVGLLLFDVLRPERRDRPAVALTWQPLLIPALAHGVVEAGEGVIGEAILWAANYLDEEGWRSRIERDFGVKVRFSVEKLQPGYQYVLVMGGITDLLNDPRAFNILQASLAFRPASGVLLALEGLPDRVSLRQGEPAFALIAGQMPESPAPVDFRDLVRAAEVRTLGGLFGFEPDRATA